MRDIEFLIITSLELFLILLFGMTNVMKLHPYVLEKYVLSINF